MEEYQRCSCTRGMNRENNFPPAMAYVPWQHWHRVYDLDKALACGTIFPELDKPFLGVRGGCR
ncbi:spore coat associated protein CotJA [Lachnoclostridium sp. An196]|uniref:spore coat associated protein CotJA n=1 Tax=Lachnoclostridium sp. An196 TaxID=1965583 RepID=UPI0026AEA8B7|nr:spore coat associated protein CotJA [Lachnoclostridium sp. An196]